MAGRLYEDKRSARDLIWDDPTKIDGSSTINQAILSVRVNYSMDMVSEINLEVLDSNGTLARANYFSIGRHVWYRGFASTHLSWVTTDSGLVNGERIWQLYEIASVSMGTGPGTNPIWNLKLRPAACQQMKRNKEPAGVATDRPGTPAGVPGMGSELIKNAATHYGLRHHVQSTTEGVDWKSSGEDEVKESLWDVMKRTAGVSREKDGHAQFRLFEADGVLFFGTQKWFLGQWGMKYGNPNVPLVDPEGLIAGGGGTSYNYIELNWPVQRKSDPPDAFQMMSMPTCTRSDNNPIATEGSAQIDRANGRTLRPGMTIFLRFDRNMGFTGHYFQGMYLITSVSFEHIGNAPVSINFRSPERLAKDIKMLEVGAIHGQLKGQYSEV